MLFAKAYMPTPQELPQAVQHNANGDVVIFEVRNQMDQTVQVVFENDKDGDLCVRLRGWGNKPQSLGNWNRTTFEATIPLEPATHCHVCNRKFENSLSETCNCDRGDSHCSSSIH